MTVGEKRVKFSNRSAAYYEYGDAEECYSGDKTRVERGYNVCNIEDEDFETTFDGTRWTIEYLRTPLLQNRVRCYEDTLRGGPKTELQRNVDR